MVSHSPSPSPLSAALAQSLHNLKFKGDCRQGGSAREALPAEGVVGRGGGASASVRVSTLLPPIWNNKHRVERGDPRLGSETRGIHPSPRVGTVAILHRSPYVMYPPFLPCFLFSFFLPSLPFVYFYLSARRLKVQVYVRAVSSLWESVCKPL